MPRVAQLARLGAFEKAPCPGSGYKAQGGRAWDILANQTREYKTNVLGRVWCLVGCLFSPPDHQHLVAFCLAPARMVCGCLHGPFRIVPAPADVCIFDLSLPYWFRFALGLRRLGEVAVGRLCETTPGRVMPARERERETRA